MSKLAKGALHDKKNAHTFVPLIQRVPLLRPFFQFQALRTPKMSNSLCQKQQKGKTYVPYKFHQRLVLLKLTVDQSFRQNFLSQTLAFSTPKDRVRHWKS